MFWKYQNVICLGSTSTVFSSFKENDYYSLSSEISASCFPLLLQLPHLDWYFMSLGYIPFLSLLTVHTWNLFAHLTGTIQTHIFLLILLLSRVLFRYDLQLRWSLYCAMFKLMLTSSNLQPAVGPDGKIKEPESNVLLASIGNMQYAVTVDVLHTVMNCTEWLPSYEAHFICFTLLIILVMLGVCYIWHSSENCHIWKEWRNTSIGSVSW